MIYNTKIDTFNKNNKTEISRDYILNNVVFRLVGDRKKDELCGRPYEKVFDLIKIYTVFVPELAEENGVAMIQVTDALLHKFNITEEEMKEAAEENTPDLFPAIFKELSEVMSSRGVLPKDEVRENKMYVLSNNKCINGAAAIFYDEVLDIIAEKLDGDLIILPSSIHEVLILKREDDMDPYALKSIVENVNETVLDASDFLSQNVYQYSKGEKSFKPLF